jgi:hypothetical protein
MQYQEMIENEKQLCKTIEGRAQLRDMVYMIIDYVKINRQLPDKYWRLALQNGTGVRLSKIDETIKALEDLAKKRHFEKLCANPFKSL